MLARNCRNHALEVMTCAIPSSIPPLRKKRSRKLVRSAVDETHRTSRCAGLNLRFSSTHIPARLVPRRPAPWECMSKPCASGESAGPKGVSAWRTSPGQDGRGVFPPEDRAQALSFACELPSRYGLPFSHFTLTDLLAYIHQQLDGPRMALTTLWRWLKEHALRPWQSRMWLFPRDPDFLAKATPVLDLYQGMWLGEPLGSDDFVICADEKPGIQVIERCHPPMPPRPGRCMRLEHEYIRHGTVAYLAALDVQSGRVIGRVEPKTGIQPFGRLVHDVMRRRPYRKARRVFWIVDNGSSHQPATFPERLRRRYPNAIAVHLPKHASWLNQVELYFSILQRKVLTRGHFTSPNALAGVILDFQQYYNRIAKPFDWRFTVRDLKERLAAL